MNNGQPSRGGKWLALKELEKKSAQCSSLTWGGKKVSSCVLARQLPGCKTRAASASLICLSNHWLRRKPSSMGGSRQRVFIPGKSRASPLSPGVSMGAYREPLGTWAPGSSSARAFCLHLILLTRGHSLGGAEMRVDSHQPWHKGLADQTVFKWFKFLRLFSWDREYLRMPF